VSRIAHLFVGDATVVNLAPCQVVPVWPPEGDLVEGHCARQIWDRCYDFKNISQKKFEAKIGSLTQIKGNFAEKVIITLVFEKKSQFFAENWQKSQKIQIITSVPNLRLLNLQLQRRRCSRLGRFYSIHQYLG
jgi:hypothetical protein